MNATASFSSVTAANPVIRALIREVTWDELCAAVLPDYFLPLSDTNFPDGPLAATIRGEVHSALSGMCRLPPAERGITRHLEWPRRPSLFLGIQILTL